MYFLGIPGHVIVGYADSLLELCVLTYLLWRLLGGRANGLHAVTVYMLASVGLGGLRMYAAFHFGSLSQNYAVCYWLTDFALVFALFLLIVSLFRRVCADRPEAWQRIRTMLMLAFGLTGAGSYITILHRGHSFFPYFVIEFDQDIYFACLLLTTMLYLTLTKFDPEDDQLGLLITGLGVGVSAYVLPLALYYMSGRAFSYGTVTGYTTPLCDIGMVLIWFYTAARVPRTVCSLEGERATREMLAATALAPIRERP